MDKVAIPHEYVVPISNIAPSVFGLRIMMVNVYAIAASPGDWMLVDCGLPYSHGRIKRWTEDLFGENSRPKYILLTHGHFDHTGSVEALADQWDVPVYVHSLEVPYVTGQKQYPPPDPSVGGGLMALLSSLYPRGPVDVSERIRVLPADAGVPDFDEWRFVHTPGHTIGHVSLFRDTDRVLIAGDAFVTTKQESLFAVVTQRPELHGPPAYYTTDWVAARESLHRLARMHPKVVATGHGQPLAGDDVAGRLQLLATDFDRIARPEHGRYVEKPAA